jgi:hypothetical protein
MKLFFVFAVIVLTGCSALSNPQRAAQSVTMVDARQNIMKTTCSGAVEDWPNCYARAQQSCPNGYLQKERNVNPMGGKRELVFQCK